MIRRIVGGIALIAILAAGIVWFARRSIADNAIAAEFAKRGITASYRVAEIGFRWQRLENIHLGNPTAPDLTADWAEVALEADWNGVRATTVRAGGVRLRGRLIDDKITWGQLDKLLPTGGTGPFALPNLEVDIQDARIGVLTAYGPIGARLDGHGRLNDGFTGKLAMVMPQAGTSSCAATRATAYVDVEIRAGAPALRGPLRASGGSCGGFALAASSVEVDVVLSKALSDWRGSAKLALGQVTGRGATLTALTGTTGFSGNAAGTLGIVRLAAPAGTFGAANAAGLSFDGKLSLKGGDADGQGNFRAARIVPGVAGFSAVKDYARQIRGTPLGPIGAQLSDAIEKASSGAALDAEIVGIARSSGASATVTKMTARTQSGAVLTFGGGSGLRFGALGFVADGRVSLVGGGFPAINADVRRSANGDTQGATRAIRYVAGDAAISLSPVSFFARPDGYMRLATVATIDGPLPGGHLSAVQTPVVVAIDGRGNAIVNPGCAPLSFTALDFQSLHLGATTLRLCPTDMALVRVAQGHVDGGAVIAGLRLTGRLGATPIALGANSVRLAIADGGIGLSGLKVQIGRLDNLSLVEIARIDGKTSGTAVKGQFSGLAGHIGKVPLLVDQGAGPWRFDNGKLNLGGAARVADSAAPERFHPLTVDGVALSLADGKAMLTGMLRVPASGVAVAALALSHDLAQGRGHATLDVSGIDFGTTIQPETITPLTKSVVALVVGRVTGKGEISWDAQGVTSNGQFETKGLDLAAAFGQVRGLRGKIIFADLLGLVTEPGQIATIETVNPGIAIADGVVKYRLAAGQKIMVEDGRWPFAGGELILDPAILAMAEETERNLTFRIAGLDAAKFIEQLQLQDIAATGLFDGTIPIVFDVSGARVERGLIVARPGGGTLAYIGEVSRADMNIYAKLAFDALRSMKYRNLQIGLQGPLDGEMINTVNFTGVNQGAVSTKRSYIARQFNNLPFKFNITFRAPFRSLLSTAQKIQNPLLLLRNLPPPATPPIIQPPESEKRP